MTPQQINRAIAEACGWTDIGTATDLSCPLEYGTRPNMKVVQGRGHWKVPSYTSDLNAMHEAEGTLDVMHQHPYLAALEEVTNKDTQWNLDWNLCHATAAQRAEAFLRTIGKWEDGE